MAAETVESGATPKTTPSPTLRIKRIGRCSYTQVWDLQRFIHEQLLHGAGSETLIVCEHDPVITIGRSGSKQNVLVSAEELARRGVQLLETERGGDTTYHGPGQLVAYPLLDLTTKRTDVGWYMRTLEDVVIRTIARFGVKGVRIAGKTGVWVQPEGAAPARKIASLGVRISRWKTMHGLALNVRNCSTGFALINPCGLVGVQMTSIEQETGAAPLMIGVQEELFSQFRSSFGYEV